jgi:hypothetical protein
MINKEYIFPEAYLKTRFEDFLRLPADKKTDKNVLEAFQKDFNTMS